MDVKGIRDWVLTQLLPNSFTSSTPLLGGFFHTHNTNVNSNQMGDAASADSSRVSSNASCSSNSNEENRPQLSLPQVVENSSQSDCAVEEEQADRLARIENILVKFFRLLRRFGLLQDNLLVAKVLYRIHVAATIRAGESDLRKLRIDKTKMIAAEKEASGVPALNFSVRVLVLGKTGVGKSATINSIFGQTKSITNAFHPATNHIQEVTGTVNGVKVTFIDTPGLLPSSSANVRRNRRILFSVRRFIRKSPPDIILFFERLDLINFGYNDYPILKLITEVFGCSIWFNTFIVLTHASTVPEGPGGYPVNYESLVARCTELIQHYIHQALSDSKIENPVLLVENHLQCKRNIKGEAILPNGQVWKSQFFLYCICAKILADVNALVEFHDSMKLGPLVRPRTPSLPHLLSSFLQRRAVSGSAEPDIDHTSLSDMDEEDDYDKLPPIRVLTKSQLDRLSKEQKKEYLDELEYRETLYLKKQLREESRRRKEKRLKEENVVADDDSDGQQAPSDAVLLPDMAVPLSFDSDCPTHRYRFLLTSDRWLVRPVLDPQGWDHDTGFDGINLETAAEVKRNAYVSVSGQMSKDKRDFNYQSECNATYLDPRGPTYSLGLDVQSAGKGRISTVHSNVKLKFLQHNVTDCGLSLTSFGGKYYLGAKLEDSILIRNRLKLLMNVGQMRGPEKAAFGGTLEATLRGRDYPVRTDNISLSLTAISFEKEVVLGGGFQSEFRPIRGTRVALNANMNSRKMGQVSVKINSSEHIEVAAIAVFSVLGTLLRRKSIESRTTEDLG